MNKEQFQICQELTHLMGYNTFRKTSRRCTGKWRGTTDYSLVFDNKLSLYLSNGMTYFYETAKERINQLKQFKVNKDHMLQLIREYVIADNIIAKEEGLFPVAVKDIGLNLSNENYLLWNYLLLEVDGCTFQFIETGLNYAIRNNKLEEHFTEKSNKKIFTAGAVQAPTFIFSNVRFSHFDDIYKIKW